MNFFRSLKNRFEAARILLFILTRGVARIRTLESTKSSGDLVACKIMLLSGMKHVAYTIIIFLETKLIHIAGNQSVTKNVRVQTYCRESIK